MIDATVGDVQVDPILGRLEALERENRRMKWMLAAAFVGTVVLVTQAGDLVRRRNKVVEAEGFVLVDRTGQPRGRLGLTTDNLPELALFDSKGKSLVSMQSQYDDSASLTFFNKMHTRIHLSTADDGSAAFRLLGDNQTNNAAMFLWPDMTSGLALSQGAEGIMLGVQPDGLAGIAVHDQDGNERGRLGNLPSEVKCFGLLQRDGKAPFRVDPDHRPVPGRPAERVESVAAEEVPGVRTTAVGPREVAGDAALLDVILTDEAVDLRVGPARPALGS